LKASRKDNRLFQQKNTQHKLMTID
jgi:hypothetical protein